MVSDPNAPIVMGPTIGEESCQECSGMGHAWEDDDGKLIKIVCDFCQGTGQVVWRRAVVERRCGHREAVNVVSERHAQTKLNEVCAACRQAAIRSRKEKRCESASE